MNDHYSRNQYIEINQNKKFDLLKISTNSRRIISLFNRLLNINKPNKNPNEYLIIKSFIDSNINNINLIASELTVRSSYLFNFFEKYISQNKNEFNMLLFKYAKNFIKLYLEHPLRNYENSNNNFLGSWNVFVLLKIIKPKYYFESGFFQGYTGYYFEKANIEGSSGIAYDIGRTENFETIRNHGKFESDLITYKNCDFLDDIENINKLNDGIKFFFIDDHVSHLDRLCNLEKLHFDYLLFDDDWTTLTLNNSGESPIPSITTILAMANFNLKPISYEFNKKINSIETNYVINRNYKVSLSEDTINKAKKIINICEDYIVLPQSFARISLTEKQQLLIKVKK